MRILFILDPLESLKTYKDTSVAIMREASTRGHDIFVCQPNDMLLRQATVFVMSQHLTLTEGAFWYQLDHADEMQPSDFDVVLMRKDPPFDSEYLYSTYLLELAVTQGAKVFNHPAAIRDWNEKLAVTNFPQFVPEFLVTSNENLIRLFLEQHSDIVVKPLDGMGGSGVFRLRLGDPNVGAILETITQLGSRTIMSQRYLPAIVHGDKRILIINGKPLPYALARIPKAGETRGNLAAGGTGVAQVLTPRDIEIANTIGPVLKAKGLFLVGLDVIGEHLTEINVTSPTCMVEIAAQTDCNPAAIFMDALESECASA